MRYFTIEQRETLRDALINQAALLREDMSGKSAHGTRLSNAHARRRQDFAEQPVAPQPEPEADDNVQLRKVEETLVKLRSPEFGVCEDCGGDIAYVLLKEDPFTTHCRQCQQRRALAPFVPNGV